MQRYVLAVMTCFGVCNGASFLFFHSPEPMSHATVLHTVARELIRRGHSVTTVRFAMEQPFNTGGLGTNHTEFVLFLNNSMGQVDHVTKSEKGIFQSEKVERWDSGLDPIGFLDLVPFVGRSFVHQHIEYFKLYCHAILGNQEILSHLRTSHFDAAAMDLLYGECSLALAHELGVPVVGFWGSSPVSGQLHHTTLPSNPSFMPFIVTGFSDCMSFAERVINTGHWVFHYVIMNAYFNIGSGLITRYLPTSPTIQELFQDISGMLILHNDVWEFPRPYPRTFINILGLNIKQDPGPIPGDILHFIEGDEGNGVMMFALGVSLIPSQLPKAQITAFFEAFGRLPQRVIMRMEKPEGIQVPKNILLRKFLPQQAILAHPKVTLYFGHGGVNGLMEAIHYRKVIIVMPVWADGEDNARRLTERGAAVRVYKGDDGNSLYNAIVEARDNPKYSANVNRLADLFSASRHPPLDDAAWLMEFVAITRGADHLKIASRHLGLIQLYCLDIVFFVIILSIAVIKMVIRLLVLLRWRLYRAKETTTEAKEKKRN